MSVFICVHGELFSRCQWCSDFFEKEEELVGEYKEDEPNLQEIVHRFKKEKIEY